MADSANVLDLPIIIFFVIRNVCTTSKPACKRYLMLVPYVANFRWILRIVRTSEVLFRKNIV